MHFLLPAYYFDSKSALLISFSRLKSANEAMYLSFKKSLLRVLLVAVLFSAAMQVSLAQGFVIDTNSFLNEVDTTRIIQETHTFEDEILPEDEESFITGDSISVPSDLLYKNRWDTLYIRTGKVNFSEIHDSVIIRLNNPAETPFHFPYKGKLISKYGWRSGRFHSGMDIKLNQGDTIVSAFDGKVRIARVMSGYGKMIVIRHNNGLETVYSHLSKILVGINQEVKAGQPIGLGGRTGRATTTHLHFETRYLGEHFNPDRIIDFENHSLIRDTLIINKQFWQPTKASTIASVYDEGSADKKYHTIKQGDTLSAIARKHKTSVKRLCQLNGIRENKVLRIGTRLRVS
jgi:murein DD-endopeptidase MepM/ murein hydrolase activator NlpD